MESNTPKILVSLFIQRSRLATEIMAYVLPLNFSGFSFTSGKMKMELKRWDREDDGESALADGIAGMVLD